MPPKNKVKYSPAAVDDMDEIFSFISQDNISAAEIRRDYLRELFGSFD